ncbi:hypothetical protein [Xylanimonas oleitrophica]|uniref:hypothetical protein n=1 Tax=Xylanimonas oleitrophica TaxID=2607479 RepID=UPI0011B431F0|nr:hypothetical protein [Xylanimonas oleitrophica]
MAYTFAVLARVDDPDRTVDVDFLAEAVGLATVPDLRRLGPSSSDFHVEVAGGTLYAEVDADPSLVSWYVNGVAQGKFRSGREANVVVSWTASGANPALDPMYEITERILRGVHFVVWDEVGGAREGW